MQSRIHAILSLLILLLPLAFTLVANEAKKKELFRAAEDFAVLKVVSTLPALFHSNNTTTSPYESAAVQILLEQTDPEAFIRQGDIFDKANTSLEDLYTHIATRKMREIAPDLDVTSMIPGEFAYDRNGFSDGPREYETRKRALHRVLYFPPNRLQTAGNYSVVNILGEEFSNAPLDIQVYAQPGASNSNRSLAEAIARLRHISSKTVDLLNLVDLSHQHTKILNRNFERFIPLPPQPPPPPVVVPTPDSRVVPRVVVREAPLDPTKNLSIYNELKLDTECKRATFTKFAFNRPAISLTANATCKIVPKLKMAELVFRSQNSDFRGDADRLARDKTTLQYYLDLYGVLSLDEAQKVVLDSLRSSFGDVGLFGFKIRSRYIPYIFVSAVALIFVLLFLNVQRLENRNVGVNFGDDNRFFSSVLERRKTFYLAMIGLPWTVLFLTSPYFYYYVWNIPLATTLAVTCGIFAAITSIVLGRMTRFEGTEAPTPNGLQANRTSKKT